MQAIGNGETARVIPKLGLSIEEFAWSVGVSRSTAEREVAEGKVPSVKIRSRRVVTVKAAEAYMRELETEQDRVRPIRLDQRRRP